MAFENVRKALFGLDEDLTVKVVQEELEKGASPKDLLDVLGAAMTEVGEGFQKMELFLPDVMLASDCMNKAAEILIPAMEESNIQTETIGTVVLATVKGDIHTVGKDMVMGTLSTNGYKVIDLGKDVPSDSILEAAEKEKADIIALSALMSSTMPAQAEVIEFLQAKDIRDKYKVIIGGGCVTKEYADQIGADGYAQDAIAAVEEANKLMQV
ncbi:MAG TPA: cobalamin-dependent protein [Clostridia bacterium]|nr:cobalamin-dependent protein [Clostridia bacterium]